MTNERKYSNDKYPKKIMCTFRHCLNQGGGETHARIFLALFFTKYYCMTLSFAPCGLCDPGNVHTVIG